MGEHVMDRRGLLLGGAAGVGLGALHALAPSPASAAGIDSRAALSTALDRYDATRAGTIGLAVRDNRNGQNFFWKPRTLQSYSTVKVLVLVTLLKRAQDRREGLTSTQKSLASRMIRSSDNAATDALLAQVGVSACQRVAGQLGMTRTVVRGGSSGWWGHSTTTTRDLLRLMNALVLGTYLSPGRRAYVRGLMATVTSSQRWGLDDPLPDAVHVEQKNGWGPMSSGYRLNTVGHVSGYGRSYQVAILSTSPNGFTYGKTTINRVSRIVYDALDKPLT
ncbi:MAG TPA: serine hydrolase [Ornithinibacter sp.]|nr:serine hydrolase [Ornithinibacter sp.]